MINKINLDNAFEIAKRAALEKSSANFFTTLYNGNVNFRKAIKKIETYWLSKANEILNEIIEEIRRKITDPQTTMMDLVKALDVISDKYNLSQGKPTSLSFEARAIVSQQISDEELDRRLLELEKHLIKPIGYDKKNIFDNEGEIDDLIAIEEKRQDDKCQE